VNQPGDALERDLLALRYLDALDAGDPEAVAALWEQASRVPQLEQLLTELDAALLEERGAAPETRPAPRRRRALWVGVAGALAAACVLAVLLWPRRDRPAPAPGPGTKPVAVNDRQRPPRERVAFPDLSRELRGDDADALVFHWPLPETKPIAHLTSIAPELLD
jgi:hypothetical protein